MNYKKSLIQHETRARYVNYICTLYMCRSLMCHLSGGPAPSQRGRVWSNPNTNVVRKEYHYAGPMLCDHGYEAV